MTNLFDMPVYLTVTAVSLNNHNSYRVFISSLMPDVIQKQFRGYEKQLSNSLTSQISWLLPLYLYSYRWAIEVCFYEMKTFWSFGLYMLRSKNGIENFVNTLCMSYTYMRILPFDDRQLSFLINESVQTAKYVIGDTINQELFLWRFISKSENAVNYHMLFSDITQTIERFNHSKTA